MNVDLPEVDPGFQERYELRRKLGAGAMGVVFLAFDRTLEREVAVKFLQGSGWDAAALKRFFREARLLARLPHEHIVRVYECGDEARPPYITLEYVGGGTVAGIRVHSEKRRWYGAEA